MNDLLNQVDKFLNEMNITTCPRPTCLMVSKKSVDELGVDADELMMELRSALDTKKLFWARKADDWLYMESF